MSFDSPDVLIDGYETVIEGEGTRSVVKVEVRDSKGEHESEEEGSLFLLTSLHVLCGQHSTISKTICTNGDVLDNNVSRPNNRLA